MSGTSGLGLDVGTGVIRFFLMALAGLLPWSMRRSGGSSLENGLVEE